MANFNLNINGVNVNAQNVVKLDRGVTQEQATVAAQNNGMDEIMVYDQESGEAYMAYGQGLNFSGLDGYQPGQRVQATLGGKEVAIVPFVSNQGGQAVQLIYDDELNTAGEGAKTALGVAKNVGLSVLGMAKDNALETIGGVSTASYLAVAGGAAKAAPASSIGGKVMNFFVPAQLGQDLLKGAGKGAAKYGKYAAIAVGVGAAVGIGGTAIYGGTRGGDAKALEQLGTKVK